MNDDKNELIEIPLSRHQLEVLQNLVDSEIGRVYCERAKGNRASEYTRKDILFYKNLIITIHGTLV